MSPGLECPLPVLRSVDLLVHVQTDFLFATQDQLIPTCGTNDGGLSRLRGSQFHGQVNGNSEYIPINGHFHILERRAPALCGLLALLPIDVQTNLLFPAGNGLVSFTGGHDEGSSLI